MINFSDVRILKSQLSEEDDDSDNISHYTIPKEVEVFEITGPLFFGAAYKFKEAMRVIEKPPRVLIIRMHGVPIIDATGIRVLGDVFRTSRHQGTKLILSGVHSRQVYGELKKARLLFAIGKANVCPSFEQALQRAHTIVRG